ncbi:MAG: peptidoglycan-binding protein [Methylobacteriaceae bacterium]|nr:peptidoglycan-binding protein [Methylobacteriaceae bacterium]
MLTPFVRRPVESIACAVSAALLTGIVLNALAFQNARHPSPLFGTPIAIVPQADAPKPVPRPLSINTAPMPIAPATQPVPIPTRPIGIPRDAEAAPAKAADAIGDMLRAAPDSPAASATNPSAIDAARILLVQKGLAKLGYAVRPDGVMGSTTRHAIEKFERERGWPARGELTPRVLREISARSGLPLE